MPTDSDSSLLSLLAPGELARSVQELRSVETPCEDFIAVAALLRDPTKVLAARAVHAAVVVSVVGCGIPLPIAELAGCLLGRLTGWAFSPDEQPVGPTARAELVQLLYAADVVLCAEQGRLDRCAIAGNPDRRAATLTLSVSVLREYADISISDEAVAVLRQRAGLTVRPRLRTPDVMETVTPEQVERAAEAEREVQRVKKATTKVERKERARLRAHG